MPLWGVYAASLKVLWEQTETGPPTRLFTNAIFAETIASNAKDPYLVQMTSRGSIFGLYTGLCLLNWHNCFHSQWSINIGGIIACFAGLAVAVSVLNSNTASLVGANIEILSVLPF